MHCKRWLDPVRGWKGTRISPWPLFLPSRRRRHSQCFLPSLYGACSIGDYTQIVLRDAVRLELGRNKLADLIKGVISLEVTPIARVNSIAGILGYQFRLDDLTKYRSPRTPKTLPAGFMTYATAGQKLGTNSEVVRGLVTVGQLRIPEKPQRH